MSPEPRDVLRGMLFKNTSENPRAPILKGFMYDENGKEYKLSCWVADDRETREPKRDKNGNKYFSMKVEEAQQQGGGPPAGHQAHPADDDIPI